jgi:hypothetical protein
MKYSCNLDRRFGILASAVAAFFVLSAPPAKSASTETSSVASSSDHWTVETKTGRRAADLRYFIEFRARAAASYGHMYVLYGQVNGRDEIVTSRIAGLHPAGDAENCYNCSLFNWTIGHIVPVPSETGASDGDLEEKYVTARYRVWMDRAHYKELDAFIRKLQHDNPLWNALWNNCVEFGRSIAEHMGLKVPFFAWLEPQAFVTQLREMNGLKNEQLPLRDAANGSTYSASRNPPLPRQRPKVEPATEMHPTARSAKPAAEKPAASTTIMKPEPTASTKPAPAKPKKPTADISHEQAIASTGSAR